MRSIPLAKLFVFETIHLWFLYYLMMLYASGIILGAAVHRLPLSWRESGLELFGRLVASRFRAVWFALPTAAILAAMPMGLLKTSTSFIPDPLTLVGYGAFFGFGWLLYLRRDLLVSFNRDAWPCVMLALALSPINLAAAERSTFKMPETDPAAVWVAAGTGALIVWLLVFGLTGLFQRYLNRPIPAVRYVVDASYWVYLIHLPFTIWIPGLLAGVAWPSTLKIATVLAIGTVTWWLSYDLLVRNTFIGVVLNGRRYPRGLPAKATPDLPAKGLQHGATGAFAGRPEPSFASATGDPMRRENEN